MVMEAVVKSSRHPARLNNSQGTETVPELAAPNAFGAALPIATPKPFRAASSEGALALFSRHEIHRRHPKKPNKIVIFCLRGLDERI
jgi:hypothetical protein